MILGGYKLYVKFIGLSYSFFIIKNKLNQKNNRLRGIVYEHFSYVACVLIAIYSNSNYILILTDPKTLSCTITVKPQCKLSFVLSI